LPSPVEILSSLLEREREILDTLDELNEILGNNR
jgi:hypothetical protein